MTSKSHLQSFKLIPFKELLKFYASTIINEYFAPPKCPLRVELMQMDWTTYVDGLRYVDEIIC